jgi:hypothetical protein
LDGRLEHILVLLPEEGEDYSCGKNQTEIQPVDMLLKPNTIYMCA